MSACGEKVKFEPGLICSEFKNNFVMQEAKTKKSLYFYQQVREERIPHVISLIKFSRARLLQITKSMKVNALTQGTPTLLCFYIFIYIPHE